MREIGRHRRLRGKAAIGLAAMVALAVGGSLAASQAVAAPVVASSAARRFRACPPMPVKEPPA